MFCNRKLRFAWGGGVVQLCFWFSPQIKPNWKVKSLWKNVCMHSVESCELGPKFSADAVFSQQCCDPGHHLELSWDIHVHSSLGWSRVQVCWRNPSTWCRRADAGGGGDVGDSRRNPARWAGWRCQGEKGWHSKVVGQGGGSQLPGHPDIS